MEDAIDDYLLDCAIRLRPKTHQWYTSKLRQFASWYTGSGFPTAKDVREYTIALQLQSRVNPRTGQPLSTYTIHGHVQVIAGWLRWCEENGYTTGVGKISMPKVKQKVIEVFTHAQIRAMLAACSQEEGTWLAQRDRAIILLLLDTGIRAAELCGLTLADVHVNEGYIRVLGKGNKEREVGMGQACRTHLLKYLRRYRKTETAYVFVNRKREQLTVSGLDQMLYRVGAWAGVSGVRISAHTFRHTYAVEYLTRGGDLYSLSRSMGHESVSTTELYVRAMTDRSLRRVSVSVVDRLMQ